MALRVWVDLTNSPHVLVLRPVIERLRAQGAEVQVTARDFAQTVELRERHGLDATVVGRHRGARAGREGDRARRPLGGAAALGARAGASTSRSGTAPTTSRSPRGCCASRARRCSTTSSRRCSTPSTAASRRRSSCPTRSRRSAWRATARRGKLRRYPGLKEEYYLADLEPDAGGARRARPRPARAARARAHAAGGLALPPVRERPVRARSCVRLREQGQVVVLPRTPEQRAELQAARRLRRPRARDRRALAGRARRTSSSAPAAR